MATDTESMQENMTRLRMKMMQQKLAHEREKLESSASSNNDDSQLKLQQAMLRRQQLLDRIRHEQTQDLARPRSHSPRRRYTPSPLPPPSRRSLPDLGRSYHFNWVNALPANMPQTRQVIEHRYQPVDQPVHKTVVLPPLTSRAPQVTLPQIIQQLPPVVHVGSTKRDMFNKSDFMDMMMLQNAQMHHMVMQQMMLQQLPGGSVKFPTAQVPLAPVVRPAPAPPPVVHHVQTLPPLDIGPPPGPGRVYNSNPTFYDDGSNYYTYH